MSNIVSGSDCYRNPETGKIEVWKPKKRNYECACNGCVAPNGICGHIICSSKDCGAPDELECEHKIAKSA